MIKKYLALTATAVTVLAAFASCGETVEQASYTQENSQAELQEQTTSAEKIAATETTQPETTQPLAMPLEMPAGYELSDSCVLDVECIMQNPELPTGCEVTSLATALNYHGFEADKCDLSENFLPKGGGEFTFEECYIGDPTWNNGYGCYAPVIIETADRYFESVGADWYGYDLSDTDFRELFYQLEQGRAVIIWTSMDLRDTQLTLRWTTEDGDEAWFADLEHCMVLTGFDLNEGTVYAADPLKGNVTYSLERFEECYEMLAKRAVVLCEGDSAAEN